MTPMTPLARVALVVGLVAIAAPPALWAAKRAPKPPPVIDVSVVRGGGLMRYRLDGARLVVSDGGKGGATVLDRVLPEAERARIEAAVRRAFGDKDIQFECEGDEIFVSIAIADKLATNALCPARDPGHRENPAWWALCDALHGQLGAGAERKP